ncbi:MAG TPA: sigma-70 family RNA polymerase sigma factor [Candidatus Acidoferrales bacterium]|nr:sigma-70 family RNA polymerase sigma factor [Candidatus Acidoferrales bacterium]
MRARTPENGLKQQKSEADERLLVEAARRDPSRFAELYELHFERVYAYVARRVGNRQEAEDITSEVFHQALANIGKFEWRGARFAAWLLRIAANATADKWRQQAREQGNPGKEKGEEFDFNKAGEQARLFRMVKELPIEQRLVIEMRFAEEKSIREIGEAIGKTEGAVKQLQFRGIRNLRQRMERKTQKKQVKKNA